MMGRNDRMFNEKYRLIRTLRCRLFGFLLGSTLAGASVYYYILEEYKVSNEMLTEDIYVSAPWAEVLGHICCSLRVRCQLGRLAEA
jgi:hypothetical protein